MNKRGFTLGELLIVVGIISVLTGVSIPVFNTQLEKTRESADLSDVRNAYAEVMVAGISEDEEETYSVSGETIYKDKHTYSATVGPFVQTKDGWQSETVLSIGGVSSSDPVHWVGSPSALGYCEVVYNVDNDETFFYWDSEGSYIPGVDDDDEEIPENNQGSHGSNSLNTIVNKINSSSTKIPDSLQEGEVFNIFTGNVYSYNDKTYIALGTKINNQWYSSNPDNDPWSFSMVEVRNPSHIRTSSDLDYSSGNPVLNDLSGGTMYRTDDGEVYVYKYSSAGSINTPPPNSNWQKININ